ncbi:MAG: lysophospholipid acyltransferase family protein [Acidobacteriota bacterium]
MARKSKIQVWSEYALARGIIGFLGIMPRRAAVKSGILVSLLGFYLLKRLREVAFRNLEIAFPDADEAERRRLTKGAFVNLGRILGDMSQFPKLTPAEIERTFEFRISAELWTLYEQGKRDKRGIIIVSPHLGNWEMLVFAWSALYEPMSYLARALDNPLIEDLTVRLRTRFGNRPINKKNSAQTAIRVLRSGGILGILADVNAHPKEGVFVPFFGVPACTSTGVATLALRTNALIIPLCGVWDADAEKYAAVHGRIIEPVSTGDRQADIASTTALFTAEVEKLVREYPDQWLWIHKRWKTRPPGEPEFYK